MNIQIRKATASDVEILILLSKKTINANYRPFLGDEAVDGFLGSDAVEQYVKEYIRQCFVMLLEDTIIGYSICKANLIDLMMIDHDFHHRGFGTRLLKYCEDLLFQNYEELILESFAENPKANAFYKKNGWEASKSYFDEDSGVNKILFRKTYKNTPQ
jgi:GNAT superfamily N-acetyltransferase